MSQIAPVGRDPISEYTSYRVSVESDSRVWHSRRMRRWLELSTEVPPAAGDALVGVARRSRCARRDRGGSRGSSAPARPLRSRRGSRARARRRVCAGSSARSTSSSPAPPHRESPSHASTRRTGPRAGSRDFHLSRSGRRLRVRTPWSARDDSGRHDVEILPAMAFGTGHHASTLGCLLALEDLLEREGRALARSRRRHGKRHPGDRRRATRRPSGRGG